MSDLPNYEEIPAPAPQLVPQSREAEEAVLGAVLINPEAYYDVAQFLRADDFYIHRHQWIWEAYTRLHERRVPVDFLTVTEELDRVGQLAEVGGPAYITGLINDVPRCHRFHRLRQAGAAPHPRVLRQEGRRAQGLRRPEHASAAPGQHRRSHPDHLRVLGHHHPRDAGQPHQGPHHPDDRRPVRVGHAPLQPGLHRGHHLLTYFYISIIFNPVDVADNLPKYGGFIPGIRPGKNTSDYIVDVLSRITLVGAIYLAAVAILPEFLITGFKVQALPCIGPFLEANLPKFVTEGIGGQFMFGGTSILIVVGVAMDTMQQIEAQLVMRHYDGFMRRSRIRGRRG